MAANTQNEPVFIETGINESEQEGSFMNATLQGVGNHISMSIQTTLSVPAHIVEKGEAHVAAWVKMTLQKASNKALGQLRFHVQLGSAR
jgi:hypothetical protein